MSRRADLGSDAKVVHAYLVSLHRFGRDETQLEIAAALGLTRHRVWAAIRELVAAGLIETLRYGLGRPNGYALLGLAAADLDSKTRPETGVRPVRSPVSGQSGNPARARHSGLKEQTKNGNGYIPADPATYTAGPLGQFIRR